MKLFNNNTLIVLLVLISGYGYVVSCTHENLPPPAQASNNPVIVHGSDILLPGTMTKGDTTQWKLDKVHSSVLWSGSYIGAAGLLTGRFNQFGMHDITDPKAVNYVTKGQPQLDSSWAFYENDPSKIFINGYVQLNTSNTGEPGRDTGCNITNLGTIKIITGTQNLTIQNLAKIQSTKVEFDTGSQDYIITFNLTWQGLLTAPLTQTIVGRMKYIKKAVVGAGTAATYSVFGLQLTFQFNCRDFGVTSTSISDKIDIECNMNFNNK